MAADGAADTAADGAEVAVADGAEVAVDTAAEEATQAAITAPAHSDPHGPVGHAYHGPIYHGGPGYNHAYYGAWYHGGWHDHWVHPWYCGPVGWVGFGIGFGVGFGLAVWDAPWYWGYWPYYNPYCTEVIVVENTPIDYSRPIVVAVPAAQMSIASADTSAAQAQAAQYLDAGRSAFMRGDYQTAMTQANLAIARRPNDALPHEFRAWCYSPPGNTSRRRRPSTPCCRSAPAGTG